MKKQIRKVLVINSGSSSLKYQLFDMKTETRLAKGLVERGRVVLGTAAADALDEALREAGLRLHVEELVLERARARVDYENFPDCLFHFLTFPVLP